MSATTASGTSASFESTTSGARSLTRASDSRPAMYCVTSGGPWRSRFSRAVPRSGDEAWHAASATAIRPRFASSRKRTRVLFVVQEQVIELPLGHRAPRALLRVGADAQVDVRATRRADRSAGVLVEHEQVERRIRARLRFPRPAPLLRRRRRVDEHDSGAREELLVRRQGPLRGDFEAEAAARIALERLEEDVRVVLRHVLLQLLRMAGAPLADLRQAHVLRLQFLRANELLAERRILAAVLARVAELHFLARRSLDHRRSVDVRDEHVERVLQPRELQVLVLEERGRLDLAPRGIRLEPAALRPPAED